MALADIVAPERKRRVAEDGLQHSGIVIMPAPFHVANSNRNPLQASTDVLCDDDK